MRVEQGSLPFTDPPVLRKLLEDALAEEAGTTLEQALAVVDELETLWNQYGAAVESTLQAYIEESANRYTGASQLLERFEPLDRERLYTLRQVIALRQALFALLSDAQWEAVFH